MSRQLSGSRFVRQTLDGRDFSRCDLQDSLFRDVSLCGADFSHADLRGVQFIRCNLRGACFDAAVFGSNEFRGSCLAGATKLSEAQQDYVVIRGGSFIDMSGWEPDFDAALAATVDSDRGEIASSGNGS
jgi:uncharacterized protein YjbI with pentapeptide repeats